MLALIGLVLSVGQVKAEKLEKSRTPVTVVVHLDEVIGKVSPYIYGTNDDRPQAWTQTKRHTFGRIGGNRWTAYNWENNASNAGKDWHHQNDGYLSKSEEPGRAVTDRLDVIQKYGAPALVTIPIQGWVAADRNGDGDVAKSGEDYLTKRFLNNFDSNWNTAGPLPNKNDQCVFQNEFVAFLESWRRRRSRPPIWYSLDNEPDLWHETHSRLQRTENQRNQLIERSILFAKAIKKESPDALVFGPAVSGWLGITTGGVGPFDRDQYFIDDYIRRFEAASVKSGKRLLDVVDVHWYPEHRSGRDVRITSDDDSPDASRARVNAVRSLNDSSFVENSWITRDVLHGPVELFRRLNRIISRRNPKLKLAVTEYYFGGGAHPSGAAAQADVLGIFASEEVFAANLFHLGKTDDRYILAAFDLYRNYDGQGSGFGDSLLNVSTISENLGVYAAANHSTSTIVLVNRTSGSMDVRFVFVGKNPEVKQAKRFQVAAPVPRPVEVKDVDLNNLVLPPMSATLIAIPR